MGRHLAIHRGELVVGEPSVQGAFFCDLCGFMFRHQTNLYKHWRTNCPEIMVFNLNFFFKIKQLGKFGGHEQRKRCASDGRFGIEADGTGHVEVIGWAANLLNRRCARDFQSNKTK